MMAMSLTLTMMKMKMGTKEMTMIFEERNSSYGERTAAHGDSTKESQVIINNYFFCSSLFLPFSAELVSELGDSEGEVEYRGLRINSQPRGGAGGEGGAGVGGAGGGGGGGAPTRTRVRHNSDGNYDDVSLMQETILREREEDDGGKEEECGEDRVYQNLAFHR